MAHHRDRGACFTALSRSKDTLWLRPISSSCSGRRSQQKVSKYLFDPLVSVLRWVGVAVERGRGVLMAHDRGQSLIGTPAVTSQVAYEWRRS